MKHILTKSLLKLLFVCLSLVSVAQKDSDKPSKEVRKDTTYPAFIKVPADPTLKGKGLNIFLVGKNYRKEWTEPVRVPVINLNSIYGGLVPVKLGGGKETQSLRVEDPTKRQWALRSVEKFPEKAIPNLRKTLAARIVKDGISAAYPYAALSIGVLADAAHVPVLKDSLVYLPDDPALGEYRKMFKNMMVLLEEREPTGIINGKKQDGHEKTISTEELILKLETDNRNRVDQFAVLQARLLDNFIMDFDRHEGQWDWLGMETTTGETYYPIPKDRDLAFYLGKGILSKIMGGKNFIPETQGFRKKPRDVTTFNRAVQNFDRFFLSGLSEEQWSSAIDQFLLSMTDAVIENALSKQPEEIRKYSAPHIISTLKKKRERFKKDMLKYYRFISNTVSIVGTNQPEQISISNVGDGKVSVVMNTTDSAGKSSRVYERTFDTEITREIRIYGLEGDDKFTLNDGSSKIKFRLIGGPGNDAFVNESSGRNIMVYDASFEENIFSGDNGIRKKLSTDPQVNNYTRLGYRYNKTLIGLFPEYSVDVGLSIGPKLKIIKHGFRKEPFASSHLIAANRAINSSSWHFKYQGEFIKVFGKTDILLSGDVLLPTRKTFFFGFGNNTEFDQTKPGGHKYYFARYDLVNASLLARNKISPWLQVKYGPVYQYFKLKSEDNEEKYISLIYPDAGTTEKFYEGKSFAGGELGLEINTRNDQVIPTRGIKWNMNIRSLAPLNNSSHPVTQVDGDISFYTDFIYKKHVVFATSFGASHLKGVYEIPQAQYLGYKQNLRGFRINRFAGRSRAYNNTELRFLWQDANLLLFRGSFGLIAFHDVGRVWENNEKSTEWHNGYGGGIMIAPLDRIVVTGSLMYSKEEKNLILLSFGFQF